MAPSRKSKSVKKDKAERSASKDARSPGKSGSRVLMIPSTRKRTLSELLGAKWSKGELQRFYEAYRKYGKDWGKISSIVRCRSMQMVEALYNMNKAYLSLPEGTASVVGLIAMMTDYYSALEASDGDEENEEEDKHGPKPSGKAKKRGQEGQFIQEGQFRASKEFTRITSGAPNRRSLPSLKRRRSDGCLVGRRTPRFPVSYSVRKNDAEENHSSPNKRVKKFDADDVEHVEALASMKTSLRECSSQHSNIETIKTNLRWTTTDEDLFGHTLCSKRVGRAENADHGKKEKLKDGKVRQIDDDREACNGRTEELNGYRKRRHSDEVTDGCLEHPCIRSKKKRNNKVLSEDTSSSFDALHTLANLSLMMPSLESDPSLLLDEDKSKIDLAYCSAKLKTNSTSSGRTRSFEVQNSSLGKSNSGRNSTSNVHSLSEERPIFESATETVKGKDKRSPVHVLVDDEKFRNKSEDAGEKGDHTKRWKTTSPLECSSSSNMPEDLTVSLDDPSVQRVNLLTKKSKRKTDPTRFTRNKIISYKSTSKSSRDRDSVLQDTLSCCLSSYLVRRWCCYEWFYSALDYPWFAQREFIKYLNHVGLGHVPRLTRVEWGVIRSSLGKPRRFSNHFLYEEREKLKDYRNSARKHYTELRIGSKEGLPTDLARPLSVGQHVNAIHPKSREVHGGTVLTVDHDKCRIQFDNPDLGAELVMDIDCMPMNPLENMPEALRRYPMELQAGYSFVEGSFLFTSSKYHENLQIKVPGLHMIPATSPAKAAKASAANQPNILARAHERDADVNALSELNSALDKKEALLVELKIANDNLLKNQNDGDGSLKESELFRHQYATVLCQLKEVGDQVSSSLLKLRQRNAYSGNSLPPWMTRPAVSCGFGGPSSSFDNSIYFDELGYNVIGIVKDSRSKAYSMVDTAIQAISSINEGEDAFLKVGEALDYLNKQNLLIDLRSSVKSPVIVSGGVEHQDLPSSALQPPVLHPSTERCESLFPSELITSCIATLLMIQMCTERQYPPADVAQILESAVTNLRPHSAKNLPVYRDIQMCMGRIKTQILALVPS